jgi:hypothetical protein
MEGDYKGGRTHAAASAALLYSLQRVTQLVERVARFDSKQLLLVAAAIPTSIFDP